ncbi:type I secretion system permease/ATPase [Altererythrobacter xixiisoli]|uniref:Type I secretion system permease/ATPase n=1 Tax=Croceibacterium xixiisoli TaxID=1476466 RepID=A0A6I4TY10_9SPHN|nr:type I secretion system permease/ATPase [Croceibacterium xixiisoli]MXP00907.1 type I secretion system permease/ATPase [Croceibacterium xixiisoli]
MTEPQNLALNSDRPIEQWLDAFNQVARHYRIPISYETARLSAVWDRSEDERKKIISLARRFGLSCNFAAAGDFELAFSRLPVIAELDDALVVISAVSSDDVADVMVMGDDGASNRLSRSDVMARVRRYVIARPARSVTDARVDTYIRPYQEHWLRRILMRDIRHYPNIFLASLIANLLAFGTILFSMQVYDRVVPANSYPTLYILFSGVILAIIFEFILRRLRMTLIDGLGKRADLKLSDLIFGHAIRVRSQDRPASTGSFVAQLRDMEQVRELLTSTSVAAIVDIPFFLVFLLLFFFIAGNLAFIPLAALVFLVIPGLLLQRRLRSYANESMREASLRNAMIMEAVQRLDDVKMLQAEARFEHQWNHVNEVTSESQMKLRRLTNSLTVWTQNIQNGVYATIVFFGAPRVMEGDMTTGALVGASILGSRMLAPLSQVTQIFTRLQHAKIGLKSLDAIMRLPTDTPSDEQRIALPVARGNYALRNAVFRYGDANMPLALHVEQLDIKAGERVALIGRNGAGKSTLLQGLSGLMIPVSGEVLLDNLALHQIDPADVRQAVGLVSQTSGLFFGSIRDNLTLGAPRAGDEEILAALGMVGADEFVRRLPSGLDHPISEGGRGLSGGQVQSLLLARSLIRQPQIVLLDEPTAAMDETSERFFMRQFREWSAGRTVVIATHRMRVLDLVDRIIVMNNGKIVLDDEKGAALETMRKKAA